MDNYKDDKDLIEMSRLYKEKLNSIKDGDLVIIHSNLLKLVDVIEFFDTHIEKEFGDMVLPVHVRQKHTSVFVEVRVMSLPLSLLKELFNSEVINYISAMEIIPEDKEFIRVSMTVPNVLGFKDEVEAVNRAVNEELPKILDELMNGEQ